MRPCAVSTAHRARLGIRSEPAPILHSGAWTDTSDQDRRNDTEQALNGTLQ